MDVDIRDQITKTNALACLECGKCTSVCPISLFRRNNSTNKRYSPRVMLTKAIRQHYNSLFQDYDLWSCLACKKCEEYCPSGIHYIELMQTLRLGANRSGFDGKCSHSGALQTLSRMMMSENLQQNRLTWVTTDLKTSEDGEILYYVGCAPYFDALFTDLDLSTLDAAKSSIKILNRLGISPVLLSNERCCGHDLLWNGDGQNFKMLAEKNVIEIEKVGAKTILFSCAECLSAFKNLYPDYGFAVNAELKHMAQFLAEKLSTNELKLINNEMELTYQDPCRLGRHLGIYDEPRQLLSTSQEEADVSKHFHEMKQHGKKSLCCGVSAWMNCDVTAKSIQTERLKQARESGAEILVVACPKCQIHLVCTMKDKSIKENCEIEIRDISSVILERMG